MVFDSKRYKRSGRNILMLSIFIFIIGTSAYFTNMFPASFYRNRIANYALFVFLTSGGAMLGFERLKREKLMIITTIPFIGSMVICLLFQ